jgi:tetratricopeptide (TPR) repeat protein
VKTRFIVLAGLALVAAAGGAWWWQRTAAVRAIVAAVLPPVPDVGAAPAVLQDRVAAAEARAHGHLAPQAGLAELSRLYHANGFLAEAMQCYAGLEKLAPADPHWLHLHASILAGFGEIEPAIGMWRQVIKLAPDYVPARLRLGDCLLKSNHPIEAAAAYDDVLKLDPANSYALLGLARIDLEAGRWEAARTRLETVVRQTNFNLGYDLIVSLYERLGQKDRAEAIRASAKASGAYRDAPDPWLDGLLADCLDPYRLALSAGVAARAGEPAVAVGLLQRAIELAPGDVSTHFQLGTLSVALGDLKTGREQLELCTTLSPQFADGWAHLSALQAQQGEVAAAARTLATGLATCPNSPALHLMHAHDLQKSGQVGEAIAEFRASIQLRPNEPEAYIELANVYLGQGREGEAVEQLRAALEADPGDPMAISILAFHAITTGDEAEARRWLARVELQPRVPKDKVADLAGAYRRAFGHDWIPSGR